MLARLRDTLGQTLHWVRPSIWRREYELRGDRDVVATLRLTGLLGNGAEAAAEENRWVLHPHGLFHQSVTVTRGDSDVECATIRSRLFGEGTFTVEGGRQYDWKPDNFWRTRWSLWDASQAPLFHLRRQMLFPLDKAEVALETPAYAQPDLPLLLVVAWHSVLLHRRRHSR